MIQIDLFAKNKPSVKRVFRYPGSKTIASKHFTKYVPLETTEIVSPFLGGGSFELYLTGRHIKVHGSDLFEPLVNLWKHILTDNKRLADLASYLLHKYSRDELKEIQRVYDQITDDLERAAYLWLFYCLSWNGIGLKGLRNYIVKDREAYLKEYVNDRITFLDRLESFSNPFIEVVHSDYREQLNRFPTTFAYLDPPYPLKEDLYGNSSKFHTDFDHKELRDILKDRNSLWMLSYNDDPLIIDLYSDDDFIIKHQWWNQRTNARKIAKEIVILPNKRGDTCHKPC